MNPSGRSSRTFDECHEPLRQPNIATNNSRAPQSTSSGLRQVTLSAEAPEFIPFAKQSPIPLSPASVVGIPHQMQPNFHQIQQQQNYHPHLHQQQSQQPSQQHLRHHYPMQSAMNNIQHHQPQQPPQQQQPLHNHIHRQPQHQLQHLSHSHSSGHYRSSVQNRLYQQPERNIMSQHQPHLQHQHQHHHQQHQHQHRHHHQQQNIAQHHNNFESESYENQSQEELSALELLNEVIRQLTDQPGLYEEFQVEIKEMFVDLVSSRFVMSNAVEMLFEQSINEPNFRYMGARLCQLLDSLSMQTSNVFRNMLCLKMNYHETELVSFLTNQQHIIRGTTIFLAELYIQLQNDGSRIKETAKCIVNSMTLLLQRKGPENVKCVCQSLKLCGYELEIDCGNVIVEIMQTLASLENELDVTTGRLIRSVLDLRANRWGRNAPISVAPIQETNHYDCNDSPVFYGPDGQVLTEEENSFLSNISSYPNNNFDEYPDNDGDELADVEPEMDLEIQLAFKDFVKITKNKQQQ